MHINQIVRFVNDKLAGEMLMYDQLLIHLDSVIDDINTALNANFPAFSEFTSDLFPKYPNYNFFPDKYIRSVVVVGAAYKFYSTDEEGAQVAPEYGYQYRDNLFYMVRDYSMNVPEMFQAKNPGMLITPENCIHNRNEENLRRWFLS